MKIFTFALLTAILLPGSLPASARSSQPYQSGEAILRKVDQNLSSKNRVFESTMIINGRRSTRSVTSRSWGEGDKKSFSEYLSPASDAGTKMLKLEGQLWIYTPAADRTIQISGHMLRQSVMGSDLSYEDMMEDRKLTDIYDSRITGRDTLQGRDTTGRRCGLMPNALFLSVRRCTQRAASFLSAWNFQM